MQNRGMVELLDEAHESLADAWQEVQAFFVEMAMRNLLQRDWMQPRFVRIDQALNAVAQRHQVVIPRLRQLLEDPDGYFGRDKQN